MPNKINICLEVGAFTRDEAQRKNIPIVELAQQRSDQSNAMKINDKVVKS